MKRHADRVVRIELDDALAPSIARLVDVLTDLRSVSLAAEGSDAAAGPVFSARGFRLYPTWPSTTVFYDSASNCFFKILHRRPSTLRGRVHALITGRGREIHALSRWLGDRGIPIPRVRAFGVVRAGRKPLYALERARGRSLYDLLVRERRTIPLALCRTVMDAVAGLHGLGYWLGDAHLSHIFVDQGEVSSFIDIDSIRRNQPPRLANLARDLGHLYHHGLLLGRADGESLLQHYAARTRLTDAQAFARMAGGYSSTRWKSAGVDPAASTPGP
jgi:tRNA A-37 threonylcarbamoyl transferase component Bud32